jgi:hypothetical protein
MGRYKPNMIDGVAGFALDGAHPHVTPPPSRAMQPLTALGLAPHPEPVAPAPLISEPEPATATLEDWEVYRRRVGPLAGRDPSMRLALAVAETQIAKLRQRMRAGSN